MKKQNSAPVSSSEPVLLPPMGEKMTLRRRLSAFRQEYGYLWLAMAIPALLFFLIYLVRGLYPFGNGTVLVLDLNGQYVYFFENLRSCVLEGNSILYSWSRALGGEFLGMYAYYVASPLSYLICLFPKERTQEFLLIMFMIKAALCGGTMGFFLHKHSERKNKFSIITFAVMYAMCAYCVVHQNNTMWIDAVMWLPLVAYGIEEVIKHGKYKVFVIFLALTLASNFYIGYMVCIFVLLYYFYFITAHKDTAVGNPMGEKNQFIKSFLRMGFFSLLAIGIAMVIVLGAYYSLSFGKDEFTNPSWDLKLRIDLYDILFKLLPSSYDTVRIDGLPFIYCGLLTVVLAPLYFCSKRFTIREKIASGAFLMVFILSFMIVPLDLIWHGFQKPQWLNNRYSFMFCFFLICLAFKAFDHIEDVKPGTMALSSGFILLFVAVLQKFAAEYKQKLVDLSYGPNEEDFEVHLFATVLLTLICLVVYVSIIAAMPRAKNKELVSVILLSVVCLEVFLSGLCNICDFDEDVGYTEYQKYNEFQTLLRPVTETLTEEYDTSFYRFEKTYHRKYNDNMALDIRGLSNSTSTLNKSTVNFLRMLGYYSQSHKSQYKGWTPVSDSLLGLKYIISDKDLSIIYGDPVLDGEDYAAYMGMTLEELQEATFADEYKDYSSDDLKVYYNPYALSLAFAASDDILNVNMKDHNDYVTDEDARYNPEGYISPFERMNAMITALLGEDETVEVFKPAIQNGEPELSGAETKVSSKHNKYTGKNGKITYSYTVPEDTMLYLFLPAFYNRKVKVSSTSEKIFDGSSSLAKCNDNIVVLGYTDKQEYEFAVTIDNTSGDTGEFYTKLAESYIYYVDTAVMEDAFRRLQENQLIIDEKYKEDDLRGTLTTNTDDQFIMTTIPYDEGWKVYVDGKQVEITQAADALVSFRIDEAGEHTVRFLYRSNAYTLGITVTVISLAIFILIIVLEKRLRRIKLINSFFPPAEPEIEVLPAYSELPAAEPEKSTRNDKSKQNKKK